MKTIIHLAGEQPIPVYMGVMQFDCPNHIIAVTDRTRSVGEAVSAVCSREGRRLELMQTDAYDMQAFAGKLNRLSVERPDNEWVFNLTGGTKPMFAAAYRLAQSCGAPCFYIETTNRTVDWLDNSGRREPLRPTLNSIERFVRLAGYDCMPAVDAPSPLDTPEGRAILEALWRERRRLQRSYRIVGRHTMYPGVPFHEGPLDLQGLKIFVELKGPEEGYRGILRVGTRELAISPWPNLAQYVCGGWFEDYLYSRIEPLHQHEKIIDLRKNLFVTAADRESERPDPFQEFDLSFSDGYCLTIVECKAGDIDQGHIQKLENLARRFGGHFGRGILIAGRSDRLEVVRERIERSSTVCAVSADCVSRDPTVLLDVKPGTVTLAASRS